MPHPATKLERNRSWIVPVGLGVILLVAATIRLFSLGTPPLKVFDEIFYVDDACRYIEDTSRVCGSGELTRAQPPLAKWLIAVGIWWLGPSAVGARLTPALVGILSVWVLYLMGRKIFASPVPALLASGFLAIDFLHVVNSRTAYLEVFAGFFVLLAFLFYLLDRSVSGTAMSSAGGKSSDRPWFLREIRFQQIRRRWRVFLGLSLGLALASKWTTAPVLVGVAALIVEDVRSRSANDDQPYSFGQVLKQEAPSILLCLAVLPAVVYAFSFIGRLPGDLLSLPWSEEAWIRQLFERQRYMLDYHFELRRVFSGSKNHPYASAPWSWPLVQRPVSFSFAIRGGHYHQIVAIGNPLVWWPALGAALYALLEVVRRRRCRSVLVVPLVGLASTYGFWLLVTPQVSNTFLYYFGTAVPFLCLLLGWAVAQVAASRAGRSLVVAYLVAVCGSFAFFWPVLTWMPLSAKDWRARMLFSDCRYREPSASPAAGLRYPTTDLAYPEGSFPPGAALPDEHLPHMTSPDGWCWR